MQWLCDIVIYEKQLFDLVPILGDRVPLWNFISDESDKAIFV